MECWVSKQGKRIEDFGFKNFEKGKILRPFSGLAPSKLNFFQMGYGSGNSPMAARVKKMQNELKRKSNKIRRKKWPQQQVTRTETLFMNRFYYAFYSFEKF